MFASLLSILPLYFCCNFWLSEFWQKKLFKNWLQAPFGGSAQSSTFFNRPCDGEAEVVHGAVRVEVEGHDRARARDWSWGGRAAELAELVGDAAASELRAVKHLL